MKKSAVIISVIIIIVFVYLFFAFNKSGSNITGDFLNMYFVPQKKINLELEKVNNIKKAYPESEIYINYEYGFSFEHTAISTIGAFEDGIGYTILIKEKNNGANAQIFIIPFDEPVTISKDRILKDLPDIVMKNERQGIVSGDKAISFFSEHETLGDTFEVWFISDNNLYQVITKAETFRFLADIIKTWKKLENQ